MVVHERDPLLETKEDGVVLTGYGTSHGADASEGGGDLGYDEKTVPAAGYMRYVVMILTGVIIGVTKWQRYAIASSLDAMRCTYEWSSFETGVIISSFYWTYFLSQIPSSLYAQRFGVARPFGVFMVVSSIVTMAMPFVANNVTLFMLIRCIQGIVQGATVPLWIGDSLFNSLTQLVS